MFAGIKVAIVLSVTGAIVAEFVAANEGLGYLILQANYSLDTAFALVILLILALLSLGLFWLIDVVQKRLTPWSAEVRQVDGTLSNWTSNDAVDVGRAATRNQNRVTQ